VYVQHGPSVHHRVPETEILVQLYHHLLQMDKYTETGLVQV
jgi:hypothetical protein